jgi:probable phosphoglycerate mutase
MPLGPRPHPGSLRLYLIRHGETEWSLSGRHTGRTDLALTAHGEQQARTLVSTLASIQFEHVFTSPLQRARQTCTLAGLGACAEIAPDLAEWDYGEYEGRRSDDIRMTRPGWTVYRDGCPGGEDAAQVSDRADRLIAKLADMSGNIALFSHGQFSCSFAARWIGSPVSQGQHLMLGTASLSVLGYNPSHPDIRAIVHWNTSASPLNE